MNLINTILFQATLSPDTIALAAQHSIVPYGRLAQGILSAEQRLAAIGIQASDTVGLNVAHPIDHLVFACALLRMGISSRSLDPQDPTLEDVPLTAILSDSANSQIALRQPVARMILVNASWFQDAVESSVTNRTSSRRDSHPGAVCRITTEAHADGRRVVRLTRSALEAQVQSCVLAAPPDWERMLSLLGVHTASGFAQALCCLSLGRTLAFAEALSARQVAGLYKHHYLVAGADDLLQVARLQDEQFIPIPSLRGLLAETDRPLSKADLKKLGKLGANTRLAYAHPDTGIIGIGYVSDLAEREGAIGYVAPWCDMALIGDRGEAVGSGQSGTIMVRLRSDAGLSTADHAWLMLGQRGHLGEGALLHLH